MATQNAINLRAQGVVTYDGAGTFQASTFSQYDVLLGDANNLIHSISPSSTAGVALISQGATSYPAFGTIVVQGGGTGLDQFTPYALIAGGTTSTDALQQVSGLGSSGQVLQSAGASALPIWADLPANNFPWEVVTGATQALQGNKGYVSNAASGGVAYTLPATASVGSIIEISGLAAGSGWSLNTGAGQTIQYGSVVAAANTNGALSSTVNTDSIRMVCAVADSVWIVLSSVGNISYID